MGRFEKRVNGDVLESEMELMGKSSTVLLFVQLDFFVLSSSGCCFSVERPGVHISHPLQGRLFGSRERAKV